MPLSASFAQSGMAQGHHHSTSLHHSHNARDQPHQRRTSNNGSSSNKHPPRPRSRHNSGHSSCQRDRTHSNSNNIDIHVGDAAMTHYASKFSASNIVITNVPPSSLNPHVVNCNGMNGIVGSSPIISSSTTTTFYSGVKLAPPVQSASVEELERRSCDQKVWYTIQVFPCHLVIPGGNGTIPRKSYRIYRRYEDVADFADQLEEEFPAPIPTITSPGAPSCSFAMEGPVQELARPTSGSSVLSGGSVSPTPLYLTSAALTNNHNASTHHNLSPSTAALREKGVSSSSSHVHAHICTPTPGCATTPNAPATAASLTTLPKLKSRLVLFVTKAVCVQRKDELDRYLQDLFALGPIIAQSRLVAEFFGIWKTDMEMHLSHENRDPLALHAGPSLSPISASLSPDSTLAPSLPDLHHGTTEPFSPSSPSDIIMHHILNDISPIDDLAMDCASPSAPKNMSPDLPPSTHLASPSLSPSPNPYTMRVLIAPTTALTTDDPGNFSDVEMASPTEPSPVQGELVDGNESETAIEIDLNTTAANSESVTTRTIKKFRSLRRPSATPTDQQRPTAPEALAQDGTQSTSKAPQGSTSPAATSASGPAPISSTKPKIMKRAKTIVFRPEVTMQPLSSKNVIPPWNRIPSTMAPISPVSPTSPILSPSNGGSSDSSFDSTLFSYNEEPPRKMSMTQSKTMSSIPTQPALFSLASGSSGGASYTVSSSASIATFPSGLVTTSDFGAGITRRGSVSSQGSFSPFTTPLVAPWNRVNSKSEINTHLHSLIKIAGQPSPSLQSPFVPVDISKSVKKKQLQAVPTAPKGFSGRGLSKSVTVPANLKDYQDQNPEFSQQIQKLRSNPVPVLTQPMQIRNRISSGSRVRNGNGATMTRSRSAADTSLAQGVVPIMTISAPGPSRPQQGVEQDNAVPSDGIRKKRAPRRESGSLHSPSVSTKQPVSILKNSGTRKSSLTVPVSGMFSPSQIGDYPRISTKPRSSSISVATTFKIVMDADTIVALQVVEDPREFVLTLAELRTRIEAKLLKSNIQLPAAFDLVWKSSASASIASIASAPGSPPSSATLSTSTSSFFPGQGLVLKTDLDLLQAIQGSKNRKVTLRCTF